MLRPMLDAYICRACRPCQARPACKTRAIIQIDPDDTPYIALERCSGCSACVLACAYGAIAMRRPGEPIAGGRNTD